MQKNKLAVIFMLAVLLAVGLWQFSRNQQDSTVSSDATHTTSTELSSNQLSSNPTASSGEYSQQDAIAHLYEQVLLGNSSKAVTACSHMQQAFAAADADSLPLNTEFTQLAVAWKQVQASYILGGYDDYISDYPRLIDFYALGNEDLSLSLQRALNSDSDAKTALFKNSYKSINALEFMLHATAANPEQAQRQIELAQVMTDSLCGNLQHIHDAYEQHKDDILNDDRKAVTLLFNVLVDSSYQLRERRIGDPAGLNKKYTQPNPSRAEYPYSNASVSAMQAILQVHRQLVATDTQPNLASYALLGADSTGDSTLVQQSIQQVQADLAASIAAVNQLPTDQPLRADNASDAFAAVGKLQQQYYGNVIKALNIDGKILEADGD